MTPRRTPDQWDIGMLCGIMHDHWTEVFRRHYTERKFGGDFPKAAFTVVKSIRNAWAHQAVLRLRDAYRVLDLMTWILDTVHVPCAELHTLRLDVLKNLTQEVVQTQMEIC